MAIKLTSNNGNIDLTSTSKVIRGIDGGYYTPVIDAEGNLTWIASLTDMEDIAAINIMGPEGKQGLPGKDGERGPQGIQGIQGIPGKDGKDGEQGPQGKQGLTGPAGKDGVNGKDGAPGKDGIDGKDGEKGESGVYIGTEEPTDDEMLIWINPDGGESEDTLATTAYVNDAIAAAIGEIENGSY